MTVPGERLGVLLLWGVPLVVTAAGLALVGLGWLALALLGVELAVAGSVALARRRPRAGRASQQSQPVDGAVVVVGLALAVAAVVALLVLTT